MVKVAHLVTIADLQEGFDARHASVSARHEAVLDDGRRLLLLDDRGWSWRLGGPGARGLTDPWWGASEREIVETARMVVGPDEAFGGRSQEDMAVGHWNTLADTLRAQGVDIDGDSLRQLRHDVVLSDRLRVRLGLASS